MELVTPKTFLVGYTVPDLNQIREYLEHTGQEGFESDMQEALRDPKIEGGDMLCSFFAKLCYASLVPGKNDNLTRTRSIRENIIATLAAGHGSVFEHCWLNFVTTDCSRVFTHELVRHRAGTAFSQTSGRYVRTDSIRLVWDPILDPVKEEGEWTLDEIETRYRRMAVKLRLEPCDLCKQTGWVRNVGGIMETGPGEGQRPCPTCQAKPLVTDFDTKKKLTSALRRFIPQGVANEIGWSVNLRALRHLIMLRTSPGAEWEIRRVFQDVYQIVRTRYPLMFHDAKERQIDDLLHVYGMKMQPYEVEVTP